MAANPNRYCMCIRPQSARDGTKAALLNQYRWPDGAVITLRFLGGDQALQDRVKAVAEEWVGREWPTCI
jgi:serralysin